MTTRNAAHALAEILDPVLGDLVSDVAFAELLGEVLDDLAARFAALDAEAGFVE